MKVKDMMDNLVRSALPVAIYKEGSDLFDPTSCLTKRRPSKFITLSDDFGNCEVLSWSVDSSCIKLVVQI